MFEPVRKQPNWLRNCSRSLAPSTRLSDGVLTTIKAQPTIKHKEKYSAVSMPRNRHRIFFNTAFLLLSMCTVSNINAAWHAALTINEQEIISDQAKQQHQFSKRSSADAKNPAQINTSNSNSNSTLGLEVLMVELQEKKSRTASDARIAEVYLFDYATDTASVQLINADTFELIRTSSINQIHLPLNQKEQALSIELMLNNAEVIDTLNNEHLAQFGSPLPSLQQLDMKLSIWQPGPNNNNASFCERTRCALVSIFTNHFYNFSIEPVIELKQAIVHLDLMR